MLLAVLVTLVKNNQIISYEWLAIGLILGILVGATAKLTCQNDFNARVSCIV